MRKCDGFSKNFVNNVPIGIDGLAVAKGALDAPLILMSFHRTPTAFAENAIFVDAPRTVGAYKCNVGPKSWAQKATVTYAEKQCRIVAH